MFRLTLHFFRLFCLTTPANKICVYKLQLSYSLNSCHTGAPHLFVWAQVCSLASPSLGVETLVTGGGLTLATEWGH